MTKPKPIAAFNSPFELGVRMVYLLNSLQPAGADLQKLVLLDIEEHHVEQLITELDALVAYLQVLGTANK